MAEKAQREIEMYMARANQMALNWLEGHILQGGLLKGGSGVGSQETSGFPVHLSPAMRELRSVQDAEGSGVPVADQRTTAATGVRPGRLLPEVREAGHEADERTTSTETAPAPEGLGGRPKD